MVYRPTCIDTRRVWFATILVLCAINMAATLTLTLYARADIRNRGPPRGSAANVTLQLRQANHSRVAIEYSITTMVVLLLLSAGVAILWRISEVEVRRLENALVARMSQGRQAQAARQWPLQYGTTLPVIIRSLLSDRQPIQTT